MMHTGEQPPHTRLRRARRSREIELSHTATIELVPDDAIELPNRGTVAAIDEAIKRLLDVVSAFSGLLVLSPLFFFIGIAIKTDSRGPIFFRHRRLGRDGKHFDCLKFRTMTVDAEHHVFENEELRHQYVSHHFKIPAHLDPRITKVGRFLRRSSLDELPQLWNVFVGQMSLVGPRPIVALEATHYGGRLRTLLSVRPGMTGLWAVEGRSKLGYPTRADVELSYVRTRSLITDIAILARTPWTVLTQRGSL